MLGPRILSPKKAAARRKREEIRRKRRSKKSPIKSTGSTTLPPKNSLIVTGSVELAEEAARQLGESDLQFQHELLIARGKYAKAMRETEDLKERVISMQSAHELQLELTIQTGEEHRAKQRKIMEKQKSDFLQLQLKYEKSLH